MVMNKSNTSCFVFSVGKKGDFNFVLLFAIVAGIAILLLAIYGAMKAGSGISTQSQAELAKSIEIITDPMHAGFAEATTSRISFKKETRITNECDSDGFGKNIISAQAKSSIGDEWDNEALGIAIPNKYIFSESEDGKDFYIFSKAFNSPFKVADLLFVSAQKYCLVFPPEEIAEKILALRIKNIGVEVFENNTCEENSIRVCFDFYDDCNMTVVGSCNGNHCDTQYDYGYVEKDGENLYFYDNLLYGAIFSDKYLYDCNVQRLLRRLSSVANIYAQKAERMNMRGCNTLLGSDMILLSEMTADANLENLEDIFIFSENIDDKVTGSSRQYSAECGLW